MENRQKMSGIQRAKQFIPFAALSGLDEAIASRANKKMMHERPVLSDDCADEINRRLIGLEEGDVVNLQYFKNGIYREIQGRVSEIDFTSRKIFIGEQDVRLDNIIKIMVD